MTKNRAAMLVVLVLLAAVGAAQAGPSPGQKCAATKKKLAGKKTFSLAKCDAASVAKNVGVSSDCVQKARGKFSNLWDKVESKGGCNTTSDKSTIEGKVDSFMTDLENTLHLTGATPSRCTAAKFKDAGKKAYCRLKCHQKAQLKALPLDQECTQKCTDKFTAAFAKDETMGDCRSMSDTTTVEGKIDDFVDDVADELPTGVTTTTTSTSTTTTAIGAIRCCQAVGACLEANDPALTQKCNQPQFNGTVAPLGQRCDYTTGFCGAASVHAANCCECPSQSPPFPHPQYCFETNAGSCGPVCVLTAGVQCGPATETCGGQ